MARPVKEPDERRSQRFNLRFTLAEKAHVEQQARLAGLDAAEYLRRRALEYQVPLRAQVDPALITELNRLALQFSALGNLANQLALSAHVGREGKLAWEDVVREIHALRDRARDALERVLDR